MVTSILGLDLSTKQLDGCSMVAGSSRAREPLEVRSLEWTRAKVEHLRSMGSSYGRITKHHTYQVVAVEEPMGRGSSRVGTSTLYYLRPIWAAIVSHTPDDVRLLSFSAQEWRKLLATQVGGIVRPDGSMPIAYTKKEGGHELVRRVLPSLGALTPDQLDATGLALAALYTLNRERTEHAA